MSHFNVQLEVFQSFLFLLTRCSGIFIFTPFLGSLNVPVPVRIVLSFILSYLLALTTPASPYAALELDSVFTSLVGELVLGMAIGFAAFVIFAGLQYAGQIVGFQMGLSLVNAIDPQTSNRSSVLAMFQNYLGLMLFLGFNGHHWFLQAIAQSTSLLPVQTIHLKERVIVALAQMVGQLFIIGFQVAAPVLATLLLTDLVLAIIGRSAPQIHILVIGFPMKALVGLSSLGLALYFFPLAMRGFSFHLYRDINHLLLLFR
ncbi:MAG: flagellar biosynthetic protein FliR [Terriglobia bacterium]